MSGFNAKRARAKRPCPLWVDAFQRDTQHLSADEVGAYMLILMAMWTRETCDFPDDDRRLAAVSKVSLRLWKSRIGPIIREFLDVENGALISQRLRKEATYVERQVTAQSDRKNAEKSDKPLKDNEPPPSADETTDDAADMSAVVSFPTTQQPTNSETNVSDGEAVEDATEILWSSAREWIVSKGVKDPHARSAIGKWIRDYGAEDALAACRAGQAARTGDPIPYVTKVLSGAKGPDLDNLLAAIRTEGRI